MSNTLLIVRDESHANHALDRDLLQRGFRLKLALFAEKAIAFAQHRQPDLLLVEIQRPVDRWIDLCQTLRKITSAPIVLLIPSDVQLDRIHALESGADDCISESMRFDELAALLQAHIRRARLHQHARNSGPKMMEAKDNHAPEEKLTSSGVQRFGTLVIDLETRRIQRSSAWHPLRPKELALLLFFVRNQGTTFSRTELFNAVWGKSEVKQSRTVDVHVRWLRKKVEKDPANPEKITTVRGIGYRFNG